MSDIVVGIACVVLLGVCVVVIAITVYVWIERWS